MILNQMVNAGFTLVFCVQNNVKQEISLCELEANTPGGRGAREGNVRG